MKDPLKLFGGASRVSPVVHALGYSGSPLMLDEWLKLQATIKSSPGMAGAKHVMLPPVIVSCAQCGETEVRRASDVAKHFRKGHGDFYCSNACWGRATNDKRFGLNTCLRCGEPAPKNGIRRYGTPRAQRIFCSEACKDAERAEEREQRALVRMRPCVRCQAMFAPANSQTQYCSRPCASRAHSARMALEKNPMWNDGATVKRRRPQQHKRFTELRPLVLRRDGERCVVCSATAPLHVHHINFDPTDNRVSNLVTVCQPCHVKAHHSQQKQLMFEMLSTLAATPRSTTSKWRGRTASSRMKFWCTTV